VTSASLGFRLTLPPAEEDIASALLSERNTLGLEVRETPEGDVILLAYFPPGTESLVSLEQAFADHPKVRIESVEVPEVDWLARFREGFRGFVAGGFHVVPAWEASHIDERTLIVDPGRAFGTGTHESTRLCLVALEKLAAAERLGRVLDVGCGAGILGIAALRLGASLAVGVDLDAEAMTAAAQHARLNRVELRLVQGDGCRAFHRPFDVVVANIAAGPILSRRDELAAAVVAGGNLVLSGLLVSDLPEVLPAFAGLGAVEVTTDGEWAAVSLRRGAA
jgi:ribosomal protein L11 methyltransferase